MTRRIVPIVEGHAEVDAVPVLLRRVLHRLGAWEIGVAKPFRIRRNRLRSEGEVERAVRQAVRSRSQAEAVLILVDADDDPVAELADDIGRRAREETTLPVVVAIANREFEAWFLAAKESLRGFRGIRQDARAPGDAEAIRGAKERLTQNMARGRTYLQVDDQPAFAERFDLEAARQGCPSFQRLWRDMEGLIQALELRAAGIESEGTGP